MRRALLLAAWATACTSTDVRTDLDALEHTFGGEALVEPPTEAFGPVPSLSEPLTTEQAEQVALAHHRGLRTAVMGLARVRGERVLAGAWPSPTLGVGFSRSLEDADHPDEVELGLDFDLGTLLWTPNRIAVADGALRGARYALGASMLGVRHRARSAVLGLQAAQGRRGLRFEALRNQQAAWETALELHRIGSFSDLDLAMERASVEAARAAVADAELRVREAEDALALALGVGGARVEAPLAALDQTPLPSTGIEQRALEKSFALAQLREQLHAAAARLDGETGRAWLPSLGLGVHSHREEGEWKAGGHLAVGLPGFDAGRGRVAAASAELSRLRHQYAQVASELRVAVRGAWTRAESTRKQALHLQSALLPARRAVLAETQKSYNAMQISVFRLLEVQRAVIETQVQTLEATHRALQARLALDGLLAGGSGGVVPDAEPMTMPEAPVGGHGGH